MNWKFEAIEKLRQYEAKKKALESIPEERARLESVMSGIRSATSDGSPVKGGGSGREDMMLNNIVQREELDRSLEQTQKWVKVVEAALKVLDNEERMLLERLYINPVRGNLDRLCGELGIEKSSVYRRRDKALQHFTIALYGCVEI